MAKILDGYYIKARIIQESEIAHCPPHFREVWDWLLMKANHKPRKSNGKILRRGQVFTSYAKIQDALKWYVGSRPQKYKSWHIQRALRFLVNREMVTTAKTTRGIVITILNYDYYQNPKNYESQTKATGKLRQDYTINKNGKNNKKPICTLVPVYPEWLNIESWNEFIEHRKSIRAKMTPLAETKAIKKLKLLMDDGYVQSDILDQSIENGWKGLFEVKGKKKTKKPQPMTEEQKRRYESNE